MNYPMHLEINVGMHLGICRSSREKTDGPIETKQVTARQLLPLVKMSGCLKRESQPEDAAWVSHTHVMLAVVAFTQNWAYHHFGKMGNRKVWVVVLET